MNVETARALEALILPPGGLILLGAAGLFLWQRIWGRLLVSTTLIALYLLSTPYVANHLIQGLESYPALSPELARQANAQAIVVLGGGRNEKAMEYGGDTVNSSTLVRLRYAAHLATHTGLPIIPTGGNVLSEGPPEALLAKQTLEQEFKVKVAALEDKSKTTHENAHLTAQLLDQLGIKHVLLVTHAWHMPRSMAAFKQAGINPIAAPTAFGYQSDIGSELLDWLPTPLGFLLSGIALHEYAGMLWYQLRS